MKKTLVKQHLLWYIINMKKYKTGGFVNLVVNNELSLNMIRLYHKNVLYRTASVSKLTQKIVEDFYIESVMDGMDIDKIEISNEMMKQYTKQHNKEELEQI